MLECPFTATNRGSSLASVLLAVAPRRRQSTAARDNLEDRPVADVSMLRRRIARSGRHSLNRYEPYTAASEYFRKSSELPQDSRTASR